MPNPLIKWAKRNTHSAPLTPTHKERRGKKVSFFRHQNNAKYCFFTF